MRWLIAVAVIAVAGTSVADEPVRGVFVSCQTWGTEWQRPEMRQTLAELKELGATWIAIHPYAKIHGDGSLSWDEDPEPAYVVRPLRWAQERGLKVFMVPHIAYWGSPFLWRGEIDFEKPEKWRRFFADYERWIVHLAALSQKYGADAFSVGLEYTHAVRYERRWRKIIAEVRDVFEGPLTYGGNWDTYQDVPFWDALDVIGVLAYFPLSRSADPSPEEIQRGWERWLNDLERLSKRTGKGVVFTEIGYNESAKAAAQPWDFHEQGGPNAAAIQHRLVEAALKLPERYGFLKGMFFWKWFPRIEGEGPETFDLRRPALERLLAEYWNGKPAAPPVEGLD